MKFDGAFNILVNSFIVLILHGVKVEMIEKLMLKDGSDNQSEFNEIDFNPKRDYLFEYNKTLDMTNNYLNYRDIYGLRYSPNRRFFKISMHQNEVGSDNFTIQESNSELIVTAIPTSIESETVSPLSSENVFESSTLSSFKETLAQSSDESNSSNFSDIDTIKQNFSDTKNQHIMRPNNRVEHALNFLANRMKNLIYYSGDDKIHQSKVAPHLLTLGKFLNLFSLMRFDNIACLTGRKPLRQLSGTCLNEVECVNLGGISMDRCANGFGVCCICKYRFFVVFFFRSTNFYIPFRVNSS